jgi:hypothetical protein
MNGARRARPPRLDSGAEICLRLATSRDDAALVQLAQLSGRVKVPGPWVIAEVDGQLCAAVPLAGGEPLGDPFRPMAELQALLSLRAKQLRGDERLPRSKIRRARRRFRVTLGRGSQPPVLSS